MSLFKKSSEPTCIIPFPCFFPLSLNRNRYCCLWIPKYLSQCPTLQPAISQYTMSISLLSDEPLTLLQYDPDFVLEEDSDKNYQKTALPPKINGMRKHSIHQCVDSLNELQRLRNYCLPPISVFLSISFIHSFYIYHSFYINHSFIHSFIHSSIQRSYRCKRLPHIASYQYTMLHSLPECVIFSYFCDASYKSKLECPFKTAWDEL